MAKVMFCENNFGHGTEETMKKLQGEGVEADVAPCLGHCGDCAAGPIATVDGELVKADSADELYSTIKGKL